MAKSSPETMEKRRKELARIEKQEEKREKRAQRKIEKELRKQGSTLPA